MEHYSIFDAWATGEAWANRPGPDAGSLTNPNTPRDLDSTLQSLAERAQYITGATGVAIALHEPEDDTMVCRASSGATAPGRGARLQIRSGLSGESIQRSQIVRCDQASTDPRANQETCRALGIESVMVMPLHYKGAIVGIFELFADRPFAFIERDAKILEQCGDVIQCALAEAEGAGQKLALAPSSPSSAQNSQEDAPAPGVLSQEIAARAHQAASGSD